MKIHPFFKNAWVLLAGAAGLLGFLLLNGPTLLENTRTIPSQFNETKDHILSWYYEDAEWTGNWSSFPEGIVDMEHMRLSDTDMKITIWAAQGTLEGTIITGEICKTIPVVDFVLLRGAVSGDRAEVVAWDFVGGENTTFARLEFVRSGGVLTVAPTEGLKQWFPSEARLGRHPNDAGTKPIPDTTVCQDARVDFLQRMQQPNEPFRRR